MIERRCPFRLAAANVIRAEVAVAQRDHVSVRRLREVLRDSFDALVRRWTGPRPMWLRECFYRALRDVTGGGVLDLPDFRQPNLVDVGKRRRRARSKRKDPKTDAR